MLQRDGVTSNPSRLVQVAEYFSPRSLPMIAQGLLILALAGGISAGLAGVYMQGKKAGKAEVEAADARERDIAKLATDAALKVTAEAISKIKVQNRTITNEVQREVMERTVYRECQHTPEQLRRINSAITGSEPEPAGPGLLPTARPADGLKLRGNDAEADRGGRDLPGVPGSRAD